MKFVEIWRHTEYFICQALASDTYIRVFKHIYYLSLLVLLNSELSFITCWVLVREGQNPNQNARLIFVNFTTTTVYTEKMNSKNTMS